uniref:SET domain-containing protein n=1 Tax=Magallana gigas TaxID=29159 RepID=K1QLW0_MAGGI
MGRFVNDAPRHDHQCNADMEKLFIDYRPVLVLFARRFIKAGEEIRYDYGVKNLPWRCKKVLDMHMNSSSNANDINREIKSCSVVLTRLPTKRKLPFKITKPSKLPIKESGCRMWVSESWVSEPPHLV